MGSVAVVILLHEAMALRASASVENSVSLRWGNRGLGSARVGAHAAGFLERSAPCPCSTPVSMFRWR